MSDANVTEFQRPATMPAHSSQTSSLVLDAESMNQMIRMGEVMASGKATVPKHLQDSPSDCLAVIMQAMQWKMNPFAVAQKTHLVNGTLGYEAQLVNAVIQGSGAIEGRFHYEYKGSGDSLECRVGAKIKGEKEITWGEWLSIGAITTKNSPLWKTNPKQQMGYLQVKNWARAYCPGAILGVYTPDEIEDFEKPARIKPDSGPRPDILPDYPDDKLKDSIPTWTAKIKAGKSNSDHIISMVSSKYTLSDEQRKTIRDLDKHFPKAKPEEDETVVEDKPTTEGDEK